MQATEQALELEQAAEELARIAGNEGAEAFDILAGESSSTSVEVFEQKIKNTEISASRGIGIRLFRDGRPGYSFTERLTREALAQAAADALAHTELTDPLDVELPSQPIPDRDLGTYAAELEAVTFEDLRGLGLQVESTARGLDGRVENVPYAGATLSSGRSLLVNSRGVHAGNRGNSVSAYVGAVAAEGEIRKMGIYGNGGRSLSLSVLQPEFMARRAVERAVEMLEAAPIDPGELPLVLSNRISGRIFSMFSSPFFAEQVQKGQSRLKGLRGQQVASNMLHLRDEPHVVGAPGSRRVDGEGVITKPTDVIAAGVLENYLYNLESAAVEGIAPTGHGSRGYSGKAGTGFSNLVVAPGTETVEQLLGAVPRCLYVTKLEGGAGCSAVSGEISIGMQGFLYENGKRVRAVDRMTISSNWFDLLKRIRALSNEYSDAWSSVRVPDVLIESAYVGA